MGLPFRSRSIWMQSFFSFSLKDSPSWENSTIPRDAYPCWKSQTTCSLGGRGHSFYSCCHTVSLLKHREHSHPGRVPAAPGPGSAVAGDHCKEKPGWPTSPTAIHHLSTGRRKLPLVSFSTMIIPCHCRPEYPHDFSLIYKSLFEYTHKDIFTRVTLNFQGGWIWRDF